MRLLGHRRRPARLGALAVAIIFLGLVALVALPALPARVAAPAPSILITDRAGRTLYDAIDPNGGKQVAVPLADIPLACRQATVATEDSRFYQHPGVDLAGIARAAWQNWRTGKTVSGASTLTQQIARNLYMPEAERTERSLRRKLHEAWLAWRLERIYTKDELLALYLNTTYYGHFAIGIEAAAQSYFGVHARELDLAQCALLAGLPQAPSLYNPIEHLDAARTRQAVVLNLMLRQGNISTDQAEEARLERLAFASTPFPIEVPHFVMWVQSQLAGLLGEARVAAGGLRVTTTLDLDWQRQAEAIIRRRLAQLRPCAAASDAGGDCDPDADPARRVDNAALVALDPATGAIRALVGSPDYFDERISGAVNGALALRQPGSAIKPLTYAIALDPERARRAGRTPWTAATLIPDLRTSFLTAEGEPYVPQNYDRKYHGPVTVRTALANSYNIAAVRTLDAVGVDALVTLAADLGIPWTGSWKLDAGLSAQQAWKSNSGGADNLQPPTSNLQPPTSGFGLALTLGGGEVRLLDLTAVYAVFANGGARVEPYAISRVETLDGDVLWETSHRSTPPAPRATVLDPRVAFLISDILSDNAARAPAFGPGNMLEIGRPAAAKTGTTTDWRDNWTLGFTPDLAVGVWVGNADNAPMKDVSGITGAGPIWHDFMLAALRDTPIHDFTPPDGLVRVEVCADSGLLPLGAESRVSRGAAVQRSKEAEGAGSDASQHLSASAPLPVPARNGATSGLSPAPSQPRWIARTSASAARRFGCCRRNTPPGRGRTGSCSPTKAQGRMARALQSQVPRCWSFISPAPIPTESMSSIPPCRPAPSRCP